MDDCLCQAFYVPHAAWLAARRLMPSSIYDLLETRGMNLEQAEVLDLASDIASGLAYIHGQR